jgi:hypothetical protein
MKTTQYHILYTAQMVDAGLSKEQAIYIANKICNAMRQLENFSGLYIEAGRVKIGDKQKIMNVNGFHQKRFELKDKTKVTIQFYTA